MEESAQSAQRYGLKAQQRAAELVKEVDRHWARYLDLSAKEPSWTPPDWFQELQVDDVTELSREHLREPHERAAFLLKPVLMALWRCSGEHDLGQLIARLRSPIGIVAAASPWTAASPDADRGLTEIKERRNDSKDLQEFACDLFKRYECYIAEHAHHDLGPDFPSFTHEFLEGIIYHLVDRARIVDAIHKGVEEIWLDLHQSPAELYLTGNSAVLLAPGPDEDWHTPEGVTKAVRRRAMDLGFEGAGCAVLTFCAIRSLQGSPVVPTASPKAGGYGSFTTQTLYGKHLFEVKGMKALVDQFAQYAVPDHHNHLFHLDITSSRPRSRLGHSVVVLNQHGTLHYIDIALGAGIQKTYGRLDEAQWHLKALDVFHAYDAGWAAPSF
ncbi:hypothetical protein ACIQWN_32285 [Streptomyces vinaceus]|uniref:hypothetical protein n=1 Tax=Streptomyces vinaceus TaxID=1960 RepID=UPI0037F9B48F